jgi:hypothetical protein
MAEAGFDEAIECGWTAILDFLQVGKEILLREREREREREEKVGSGGSERNYSVGGGG